VGMVVDVVFTVAVVAVAAGAVTELQLRIGNICPSADGAAVIVVGLRLAEGDRSGALYLFWAGCDPYEGE